MIDTHAHLYAEEFDADRDEMIQRAVNAGITKIVLPNVDSQSIAGMLELENQYPRYCFAAIGLHPTSVNSGFQEELNIHKLWLKRRKFIAIGEIGIDLFWDKSYLQEQQYCLKTQIEWALAYDLPVIIHVRESLNETLEVLEEFRLSPLRGIFHSFTGTEKEAERIFSHGDFFLGINGIITFKNSGLSNSLEKIELSRLVIETDSPYLTPAPFRGKRNESSMLNLVVNKLSDIYGISNETIISITTTNAKKIFNFADYFTNQS